MTTTRPKTTFSISCVPYDWHNTLRLLRQKNPAWADEALASVWRIHDDDPDSDAWIRFNVCSLNDFFSVANIMLGEKHQPHAFLIHVEIDNGSGITATACIGREYYETKDAVIGNVVVDQKAVEDAKTEAIRRAMEILGEVK